MEQKLHTIINVMTCDEPISEHHSLEEATISLEKTDLLAKNQILPQNLKKRVRPEIEPKYAH